jgi:hypothetical protein
LQILPIFLSFPDAEKRAGRVIPQVKLIQQLVSMNPTCRAGARLSAVTKRLSRDIGMVFAIGRCYNKKARWQGAKRRFLQIFEVFLS